MSRQSRYRVAAILLGGLVFGVPLLTNGTASAEPVPEGARQVTFAGGGMLGISCRSRPDVESMVVPADSTVRVVNRTGYSAKLQLGGATRATLPDDAATEVVFRRGTTAVLLKPNCALGEDAAPVLVTAAPSAPATMPDPIPVPSGGGSSPTASPAEPADSDEPPGPATGSAMPDAASSAGRPVRSTPAATRLDTRRPGAPRTATVAQAAKTAAQAMPQGGAAPRQKVKTRTAKGKRGSAAAVFAGMPPGDARTILPGVPRIDAAPVQLGTPPPPATPSPADIAVAEPVAAVGPIRDGQPVGLLAVIAAVCAVGVATAAIRAIVSQRANRASVA